MWGAKRILHHNFDDDGPDDDMKMMMMMMMMVMMMMMTVMMMMTMMMMMLMMMMLLMMMMMMRMRMLSRRRKMMMLRRMMLRRKTDPKTRKHTSCEPAQSQCTWTFDQSHFVWEFTGKMPDNNPAPRPPSCRRSTGMEPGQGREEKNKEKEARGKAQPNDGSKPKTELRT